MHEPSPWPGHCDTAGLRSAASPARRCHCRVTSLPAPVAARIPGEKPLFALCFKEVKESRTRPRTCLRCQWLLGPFCFAPLRVFSRVPGAPEWSGEQGKGTTVQLPRGHRAAPPKSAPRSRVTPGAWGQVTPHRNFGMGGRCSKIQTGILSMNLRELLSCVSAKRSG